MSETNELTLRFNADLPPNTIVFWQSAKMVLTIHADGRLEFGPEAHPQEAVDILRDLWEKSRPPTPDLDAVVARVRNIAANLHDIADSDGVHHSGWAGQVHRAAASLEIEAESLLAAVARPAEARRESEDWAEHVAFVVGAEWAALTYLPTGPAGFYELAEAEAARRYPKPRPEPAEPSEAMVAYRVVLKALDDWAGGVSTKEKAYIALNQLRDAALAAQRRTP